MPIEKCPSCGETLPPIVDAFCPYCSEELEQASPSNDSTERGDRSSASQIANRMVRDGATPGMIKIRLQKEGFFSDEIERFIETSKSDYRSSNRLRGVAWVIVGIVAITLGSAAFVNRRVQNQSVRMAPIITVVVGIGLLGRGVVTAIYGIDDRN